MSGSNIFMKISMKILVINLLVFVLLACSDNTVQSKKADTDWVKDEILQQLSELRKEVKSLKDDVAKIDGKLDSKIVNRGAGKAPKEVKLNSGISFGDSNAKIAIVEFTDYQCPFCARHSKTVLPQLMKGYINSGKVRYVMYDFPLSFHAQAKHASVAARCAGKQAKYWEMHNAIFGNQRSLGEEFYIQTAKKLKLNEAAFRDCLVDQTVLQKVEQNIEYGNQLGVTGTPKFYVGKVSNDVINNIIVISGAQSYAAFSRAITILTK